MLWSFIAVCLSAWLFVDASYRGPAWQRWVFKPLTLLLLAAGRCADVIAAPTPAVRRGGILPVASAVYHLLRQPNDAVVLLAFAVGAGGTGGVADRRDLDASGRVAHCYLYLYWHHADDGLDGWRTVVLPPDRSGAVGIYGRIAPVHWQYCLAG